MRLCLLATVQAQYSRSHARIRKSELFLLTGTSVSGRIWKGMSVWNDAMVEVMNLPHWYAGKEAVALYLSSNTGSYGRNLLKAATPNLLSSDSASL